MRFNFKKITALATSVLLTGMSVGVAAAANYPAPFVSGDSANVAIVYGTGSGVSSLDLIQAGNIQTDLQSELGTGSGTDTTVEGEAYALFTSSRKLYMNTTLNSVKASLTDSQLPTVLADSSFEGDVTADVTQTIKINSNARVQFGKYPSDDDDPTVAITLGTTAGKHIYNATVSFNKNVNLTSSDSIGEELSIFGQKYTVGAGTTTTDLYLYKSSETISLSIGGSDPSSTTVAVDGEEYTVELIAASDTAATVKVTDSDGNSESKEISEDASKKVQGIDVAVNLADEDTATDRLIAEVTVGADKLKLTNGNEVRVGSDEDLIEGTNVVWSGTNWAATTGFIIQMFAEDTDEDALVEGGTFVDPVFESFKIDFSGLNIATMDSSDRESIEVQNSGDNKATVKFTSHSGDEKTINWYYNSSTNARLADSSNHSIVVLENATVNKSAFVVVGNEENGYLLELKSIVNGTSGYTDDYVEFQDVMSGDTYKSDTASAEGKASLSVQGESYTVYYTDNKGTAGDESVTIDYPDTTVSQGDVIYPTIETSKGAKLAFYEPLTFTLGGTGWVSGEDLYFPDGDGYTTVDMTFVGAAAGDAGNWSIGGTQLNTTAATGGVAFKIGELWYNMTAVSANVTKLYLLAPENNATINEPGIVVFEEQDDSTTQLYNAIIVEMEGSGLSTNGVGVNDVKFTWDADAGWDEKIRESDDDLYDSMDYYGTLVTTDTSETSQKSAVISYPDDQVYAQVYVAEESASITSSSGSTSALGEVLVKDSEVADVSTKNLIVVGGSCINSAAATLLGGAYCGADFTSATGVGSGQFLIKGYASNDLTSKHALLVAGYDAADTVNAATYLRTQTVDTSSEYMGTSSTSADLVVA